MFRDIGAWKGRFTSQDYGRDSRPSRDRAGGGQACFFQKGTSTPIVSATERREATQPVSAQPSRSAQALFSATSKAVAVNGSLRFCLARRLVELSQTREQGIESPLNPFSSCDRARQHPFQNHVILQARYTHSSHNGMIDLAGASCWGFRNARSVQETDTAGSPSFSCAGPCRVQKSNKLRRMSAHPPRARACAEVEPRARNVLILLRVEDFISTRVRESADSLQT